MDRSMMTRALILLLALAGLSLAYPTPTAAQDGSWLAWVGCWEGAAQVSGEEETDTYLVCLQPAGTSDTVEIVTYDEAGFVASEQILADGRVQPVEEGGCDGTRTASWADHGSRVFLSSEMQCDGSVIRSTRGVLSILPGGRGWAEIQTVRAGTDEPLIGIRTFVPASDAVLEARGISDPAEDLSLAVRTARSGAGGALTPEGLVELVERAGPEVTSALLVERGESLGADASTLQALAARGVPSDVLDVVVAVSYPDRFEISGGGDGSRVEPSERVATRPSAPDRVSRNAYGYSPWRFNYGAYRDPLWYGSFGYGSSLGYRPYCSGIRCYGYGYGGTGYYDRPRVIVVQPPTVENRPRLSRERGVIGDGGAGNDDREGSRVRTPDTSRDRPPRTTRQPSTSSSGTRSSPSTSSGGNSSGGGDDVRRARPR